MKKEVEIKYYLGKDIKDLLWLISNFNWLQIGEEYQEDIYYTSKYKDFISSEECLRIRETKDKCELTWKPPTSLEMLEKKQVWKEEIDLDIKGQKEIIMSLLYNLDFIEYVTVKKSRIKYDIDDSTNISLDFIESLGWFLEIETITDNDLEGTEKNNNIASILKVERNMVVNVPYRDMVKIGKVYTH